jgi:hypothetical protein
MPLTGLYCARVRRPPAAMTRRAGHSARGLAQDNRLLFACLAITESHSHGLFCLHHEDVEADELPQHLDDVCSLSRTHLTGFFREWVELMVPNTTSLTAA